MQEDGRVFPAIALAAILTLFATLAPLPAQAFDIAKFCKPDADQVVILVDVTTAFDDRAKELFQRGISGIVQSLTPGEGLRIVTIEDSFTTSKLLYSGCVPYCEHGLLDWLWSDCTDGLVRIETNRQQSDIGTALRGRLEQATADLDFSDILRTLFYSTEHRAKGLHLELFVFSDLIENSEFMSGKVFWAQPTATSIDTIKSNGVLPDLSNAAVKVFGVGRGGSMGRHPLAQERIVKLHDFWRAYFKAAQASDAQISEELYLE